MNVRNNSMKSKLLLLCISSLGVILITEILLRIFLPAYYAFKGVDTVTRIRINHSNVNHLLKRYKFYSIEKTTLFRTNNRNYIEPAFRFNNPDITIAFLGGSTTECIAVTEENRFTYLVSKHLEKDGIKVNTLNAARDGNTIHDSINILFNHVVLDNPDYAILMHATNDIAIMKRYGNYSSRMSHDISMVDIGKYSLQIASNHSMIFAIFRKAVTFKEPHQGTKNYDTSEINTRPFRNRLQVFIAACKAFGIVPILMTQPIEPSIKNELTPNWIEPNNQNVFNKTVRDVAHDTNTELIDLVSYITEESKKTDKLERIFYDGMHVTDYGSSLYALYITKRIKEILALRNHISYP